MFAEGARRTYDHPEQTSEYDVIEEVWGKLPREVSRFRDFDRWAELNTLGHDKDYKAPNGVLYCSPACAILDNYGKGWTEMMLEEVDRDAYDAWCEEAGPGNGPGAICDYCGWEYHNFG